jgi:hypothetical protein
MHLLQAQDKCVHLYADSTALHEMPHFGNNQFLFDLIDSIEGASSAVLARTGSDGLSNNIFHIPIVSVIHYTGNDTNTNVRKDMVEHMINQMNEVFAQNDVKIFFYNKRIIYGGSNGFTPNKPFFDGAFSTFTWLLGNSDADALTLHFAIDADGYDGLAVSPWIPFINKYVALTLMKSGSNTGPDVGVYTNYSTKTMIHEVGHTLGLLHTHHPGRSFINTLLDKSNAECSKCFQEPVNNMRANEWWCFVIPGRCSGCRKCEINGDLLCDTDADPDQSVIGFLSGCSYTYTGGNSDYLKDKYNDFWLPNGANNATRNVMSYVRNFGDCAKEFTRAQKGVMYHYTRRHGPNIGIANPALFYTNDNIDVYENDNLWKRNNNAGNAYTFTKDGLNNKIALNASQYHTFHHIFDRDGAAPLLPVANDVDWLYFQVQANKSHIIETTEVPGQAKPDTKIELYTINTSTGNVAATALASNDNISSSNKFSRITRTLSPGYYAVKVTNNITVTSNAGSKGHYKIAVYDCYNKSSIAIVAPEHVCNIPQTASLVNVPVGFTITWTSQNLTIIGSNIGATIQFARTSTMPSVGKLIATVTAPNCEPYTWEKKVNTGIPGRWAALFGINSTCDFGLETGFPIYLEQGTQATFSVTFANPEAFGITDIDWDFTCGYELNRQLYNTQLGLRSDLTVMVGTGGSCGELKARPKNACGEFGQWKIKDTEYSIFNCSPWAMRLSPNPVQYELTIELEGKDAELLVNKEFEYILTDQQGKILIQNVMKDPSMKIDVSKFMPGMYNILFKQDTKTANYWFFKTN